MKFNNKKTVVALLLFILLIAENTALLLFLIPFLNKPSANPAPEIIIFKRVNIIRFNKENNEPQFSSATNISTLSEELAKDTVEFPNPFSPVMPCQIFAKKSGLIKMYILDSNNVTLSEYKFPVHKGKYNIEQWAFMHGFLQGRYTFKFELPDTMCRYNINR
ncbi:MAG: hypothetical protein EHM58_06875 [Ignavibacteriae bacterium]|nr:MAG: hypothetical protein EHM58_06875 [Ignavibacteriota bacterium]